MKNIEEMLEKNDTQLMEAEKQFILEEESKKPPDYKELHKLNDEIKRLYRVRCRLLGRIAYKEPEPFGP